jgi:hypothetical protein
VNFQDKLERLVNFAIQLVNDGVPKDRLVSGPETQNGGPQRLSDGKQAWTSTQ